MNPLNRFEQLVEGLVEGGLSSLLKGSLQPVELAKRLEREMDSHQRIGPAGATIVPNHYAIILHPDDYADVEQYRRSLEQELAAYLQQEAMERGYLLRPRAAVSITSNQRASRRRPRVASQTLDSGDKAWMEDAALTGATARLQLDQMVLAPHDGEAALYYTDKSGERVRVGIRQYPFGIGRSLENALPIEDTRMSRNHAQLAMQQSRVALIDLESTNGTFVNGTRVRRCLLQNGDVISLGGFELVFELQ